MAPSRYTFILQAVARVGRSTQGSSWQDWEKTTCYYPVAPKPERSVESFLAQHRPPVKPPPSFIAGNRSGSSYRVKDGDYAASLAQWDAEAPQRHLAAEASVSALNDAWQYCETKRLEHAPGIAALHAAFHTLSLAIVDRQIAPFARLRSGGEVFVLKPDVFANEQLVWRALREGVLTEGNAQAFLFVDKAQLDRAFPLGTAEGEVSDLVGLSFSPLMQLAHDVIRDWDLSPDNPASVPAIQAQIESLAKLKGMSVSKRQAEEIARIVRPVSGK